METIGHLVLLGVRTRMRARAEAQFPGRGPALADTLLDRLLTQQEETTRLVITLRDGNKP